MDESEEVDSDSARHSLMNFLQLWARQLEDDPKGLATPIVAKDFRTRNITDDQWVFGRVNATISTATGIVVPSQSMKLIFRPPKRYLSYKEQRGMEKGVLPDRKGAKVDAWSPGGVELLIHTTQSNQHGLPVRFLHLQARRCDIDGDTIIKHSSERAIVRRLQEAIRIWKKVREMN